jgi:plastocyanin
MRFVLAAAAFFLLAAPAHAATTTVQATDALTWDKTVVDVAPGDTVVWSFAGTAQPHNVQAASTNWQLVSPITVAGPDVPYTFGDEGTYEFVCQVHPDTMRGTVRVTAATSPPPPPPPPPPLSEQPFPNDAIAPVTLEDVRLDHKRPRVSRVKVRRRGHRAHVHFRVSEQSKVTVRFKRGHRTVRKVWVKARRTRTVSVWMRHGRYRVEVRATDLAGNRSKTRRAWVRMA